MDWYKNITSKSSTKSKTTFKKVSNKKRNLEQSCANMSLKGFGADEEIPDWRSMHKSHKGVGKRLQSGSTRPGHTTKQDVYIQIPLSIMYANESASFENPLISNEDKSPCSSDEVENYNYILIEGCPSRDGIRKRMSYVMSYNKNTKNADWVYEILNKSTLENNCKEQMSFGKNEFKVGEIVYQQGHLAAAANHRWCQEAYQHTHFMSNMIPQLSDLNQGMWKTLESHCRELAEPGCNVHVYTGPLYLEKKGKDDYVPKTNPTNPNNGEMKAVPTHLFKVIIVEKNGTVEKFECYMMPNEQPEYDNKYKDSIKRAKIEDYPRKENPSNCDLLRFYVEKIENIQRYSKTELKFKINVPQHDMTAHLEKKTWKGEDKNGELCEAKIEVKILKTK